MSVSRDTEDDQRPRVLVILGAGSSLHAKAPSTEDVTEFVCTLPDNNPLRAVVDRLKKQRSVPPANRNFNFETVLATLDDLDQFSARKHCPKALEQYLDDRLSAFAGYTRGFAYMADQNFGDTHAQVIGQIKNFVIDRTACASPDHLREFFDPLRTKFDLTIVTLNYDDIIDRVGDWYDGFSPPASKGAAGIFDFAGFCDRSVQDPVVLLHLHGSVRFDFPRLSPMRSQDGEIVRYAEPRKGLAAQLNGPRGIPQPTPIIAGYGKDRWMTRAAVPFGYYYTAFTNAIQTCPRVLVAGYGGGDEHVNSWLKEEHPRLHFTNAIQTCPRVLVAGYGGGDEHVNSWLKEEHPRLHRERRIVHINPRCPKRPQTAKYLTFGGDEGHFPPPSDRVGQIIDFLDSL